MSGSAQWPALRYEDVSWDRADDDLVYIPKSRRRKITSTYRAALPLRIAERSVSLPSPLQKRVADAIASAVRFDEQQSHKDYELPATLLRSESSASSQIENLTASVRNIAFAELSSTASRNARIIAGNVAAMREAIGLPDEFSTEGIQCIHHALMQNADAQVAGTLRNEQVWIGGTPYSPHEAKFVPPQASRVEEALEDLAVFAARDDLDPVTKAAIIHVQFETIHPFVDGNGRTGRALIAKLLRSEGLLRNGVLPVSAGLLHNIDDYLEAFEAYHVGDPLPMIEQLADALELSVVIGARTAEAIEDLLDEWMEAIAQRSGSRIYDLPGILVAQPVVDANYVAQKLELSQRGARDLLGLAQSYGMVCPIGNAKRSVFYQSDDLLSILDDISSVEGIRRVLRA